MLSLIFPSLKNYYGYRGDKLHLAVALAASCSFTLFGYDQGVMSSMLTLPEFTTIFPEIDATADPSKSTVQGAVVAIYEIGCMAGALYAMFWGDSWGRRKIIWAGSLIMIIGAILESSAYQLAQLIVGRVVCGIGNGLCTATVPTWLSECARPESRGKLLMISAALNIFGVMTSYWVGFGFYFVKNSANWRFPMAFQIVFALVMIVVIMDLPESPRWLVKKNQLTEAANVFSCLEDCDADDELVLGKIREIQELSLAEDDGFAFNKLFTFGPNRHFHRAMLACFSQVMQQVCGINLITYYASSIFQNHLHMDAVKSRILAACNGTEYFLAACFSYVVIERVGRRNLMISCAVGQCITMIILFVTGLLIEKRNDNKAAVAATVFLFVFNTFFAIGWLGIPWLYPAEVAPLEIRGTVNGLSTACNWVFTFMVVMITPVSFSNINSYTYLIFGCINGLMIPVCIIFYPETAGRSLEDMDKIFEQCSPRTPWDVVKISANYVSEKENFAINDLEGGANKGSAVHLEHEHESEELSSA